VEKARIKGYQVFFFFMKPRLLSWNVRGLNEGEELAKRMEGGYCMFSRN
jgi:hypothetical protein